MRAREQGCAASQTDGAAFLYAPCLSRKCCTSVPATLSTWSHNDHKQTDACRRRWWAYELRKDDAGKTPAIAASNGQASDAAPGRLCAARGAATLEREAAG